MKIDAKTEEKTLKKELEELNSSLSVQFRLSAHLFLAGKFKLSA